MNDEFGIEFRFLDARFGENSYLFNKYKADAHDWKNYNAVTRYFSGKAFFQYLNFNWLFK